VRLSGLKPYLARKREFLVRAREGKLIEVVVLSSPFSYFLLGRSLL